MSYKNDIKERVEKLSFDSSEDQFEAKVEDLIKNTYRKALKESRKTGQSIESITYEIFEGLEEGLNAVHKNQVEQILDKASKSITEIIHTCALENISHKKQVVKHAIDKFYDTIDLEKSHLLESMEVFKSYASDHSHKVFEKNLQNLQKNINKFLKNIISHHKI